MRFPILMQISVATHPASLYTFGYTYAMAYIMFLFHTASVWAESRGRTTNRSISAEHLSRLPNSAYLLV
jgi:hypothetical protein